MGLPPEGCHWQVNHEDGDKLNNHVDNLQYVTPSENIKHSYDSNPNRGNGGAKTSKPVLARRCGTLIWNNFDSLAQAANVLGVDGSSISKVCRDKTRHVGGYEFRFDEPCVPLLLDGEDGER